MPVDKTSSAYREGYVAEAARIAMKDRARAALDAHPNIADIANEVAKHMNRDHGRKQRIVERSPHIFSAMDAEELGQASARELAARELKEIDYDYGDGDPVQALDAHHAGRKWARDQMTGSRRSGGMDGAGESWIDEYINDKG